jgi:regulator of RNase E activity RraA
MNRVSGLSHGELLELGRFNTPTIYNGWEQITKHNAAKDGFNTEPLQDFMPNAGAMVGYAVTVVVQLSGTSPAPKNANWFTEYLEYLASMPKPTIAVVQDLDKPRCYGSAWGEIFATIHRAFGCVGTITDGGLRDIDEMARVGFKALGRQLCVGHGAGGLVRWNCPVNVFGRTVTPGQLIHADKHGFLAIPPGEEHGLLAAARHLDHCECETYITAAREAAGKSPQQIIADLQNAGGLFQEKLRELSNNKAKGEW